MATKKTPSTSDQPTSDGKRMKFRTIAESRTNKAIDAIVRIGNLSNKQVYDYEPTEIKKIIKALKTAVAEVEGRFAAPGKKAEGKFKL